MNFQEHGSDIKTKKNHLVVTFGKTASRWIYLLILGLAIYTTLILANSIGNDLITNSFETLLRINIWWLYFFSPL